MENKYFANALSDFMFDMASGGAIRHLTDRGLSVDEIARQLKFPTPRERIQKAVWKHLQNTGVIVLKEPVPGEVTQKVSYVKEYSGSGKMSFRQVVEEKEPEEDVQYVPCDFGKEIYKDKKAFEKKLEGLSQSDKEYVLGIPWPLERVYHRADERILRIMKQFED